jgi:RNA polymerase sigma factor (sigma-70 family)
MRKYCEHPFFYGEKCYARVNGEMVEISRDVALAMHNTYRSGMEKRIEITNEQGEVVERKRREVPYSVTQNGDDGFSIEMIPDCFCNVEEAAIAHLESSRLHRAMGQLTAEEKLIIHGIYFEDMTQNEIAAIMGISQQAVAYRLKTTLKKMRRMLSEKNF